MYIAYGSYKHADSECTLVVEQTPQWNERGERYAQELAYRISGFLQEANPAALTTAIQKLEAAYLVNFQDIGLYNADGSPTAHVLKSSTTIEGNRVTRGVSYPEGTGAEYSTFRRYEIEVKGTVLIRDTPNLDFQETIDLAGGGPQFVLVPTRNGPPQRQQTTEQTPYRATQTGSATGQLGYPLPALPLWPNDEHRDQRSITRESPKRKGKGLWEYRVHWRYVFESPNALIGLPNVPPQ